MDVIGPALAQGRRQLFEHEVYALLQRCGIEAPKHRFVALGTTVSPQMLQALGAQRLVLKIVSADITHKSDVGGVDFVEADADRVNAAIDGMVARVRQRAVDATVSGVLLVERIAQRPDPLGRELLLSYRFDPAFGPSAVLGIGGLRAEWFGRLSGGRSRVVLGLTDLRVDRLVDHVAGEALGELLLRPGRDGSPAPLHRDQLAELIRGIALLASDEYADIAEVEINPLVVGEQRLMALDGVGTLAASRPQRDRPPRPVARVGALMHPRSAVVYGASASAMNAGRIILQNIKGARCVSYGHLYAIHPTAESIDGIPAHPNAAALPQTVDIAVITIPAAAAVSAVEELITQHKARAIILIPGGFAEAGEDDLARRIRTLLIESRAHEDGGPVMIGGNCLGIVSKGCYNTFFLPTYKLPFHDARGDNLVAISQSGAYLVTLTSNLDGIIFPRASISYGNEMDLTASDLFEYYLTHEAGVSVLAFYIEGFPPGEGARFVQLVRRATQEGRSVVVYKAGKTASGAAATASHTASLAGDYAMARALLEDAGAVVCETLNMFEDYTKVLTMLPPFEVRGRRVGVLTNAGFEAGAVGDHLYTLDLAPFSEDTRRRLKDVLPAIAHVGNPVDCTPMTNTAGFIRAVEVMADDPNVDALIVSAVPVTPTLDVLEPDPTGTHSENIFSMSSLPAELIRVARHIDKPMVVAIDSGRLFDPSVLLLERAGLPVYRKIDRASRALAVYMEERLEASRSKDVA